MKNNYPTESKKTNNLLKGFTVKQIIWFIIGALIALNALIFLILGLINDYASLPYSPFKVPNDGMIKTLGGIDFKWFGVITLILGTFIFTLSLSMASKGEDREKERGKKGRKSTCYYSKRSDYCTRRTRKEKRSS